MDAPQLRRLRRSGIQGHTVCTTNATDNRTSVMIMNVSKEDRRCLLLAVTDWIDNVAQEDTDKDEYINMVRLQKRLSTIPRVTQLTICFCGHTRGVHTR